MKWSVLLALAALAACGEGPVTSGEHGERPAIVSLNPCADAILAEVAKPGQLLAISHYSHDPDSSSMDPVQARRWPATGGTVEEVLALEPDLVVAGAFLPPATRLAFEELGIRVETFGVAASVEQSREQVRALARLAGGAQAGEALVGRIDAALAEAAPRAGREPLSALLWQPGGLVAGEDALVSELLRRTGFSSHAAARGLGQGAYLPLERVLADPPQVILSAGGERMLEHPALEALEGVPVARFEPGLLYCGGPTIILAARRLAEIRGQLPAPLAHTGGAGSGPGLPRHAMTHPAATGALARASLATPPASERGAR